MFLIAKRELRANRKSLLIWSAALAALTVIGLGEYQVIMGEDSTINMGAIVDMMPRVVQVMFGLGRISVNTADGWYVCMFLWCAVLVYLYAALLGAGILAKEERDKTAEFLFTRPLTRGAVIGGKMLAAVLQTLLLVLVGWASTMLVFGNTAKGTPLLRDISLTILGGMFLTALVFLFAGMCLAALFSGYARAAQTAALAVTASYLLSVAIEMSGKIDYLNFLSPFCYFDAVRVLEQGLEWPYILLSAALSAVFGALTHVLYKKRNLHV